jgi:GDP-L-fucose synthase
MTFWKSRRVMVTGGSGFLGSRVVARLRDAGCAEIFIPEHARYDLRDVNAVRAAYDDSNPDLVIHLAANVGGIRANQLNPA